MHQEVAFIGLFMPMLFICALVASALWFAVDGLMLRTGAWDLFWHPPLARLALYFILVAVVAALTPDF